MLKNITQTLIFKLQNLLHERKARREEDRIIDHKLRALADRTLLDRILEGNRD